MGFSRAADSASSPRVELVRVLGPTVIQNTDNSGDGHYSGVLLLLGAALAARLAGIRVGAEIAAGISTGGGQIRFGGRRGSRP